MSDIIAFLFCRWCGGLIFWYYFAVLSLTTVTCYTTYAPCTLFSLSWFMGRLVFLTNTTRLGLSLLEKLWPAFWRLFCYGRYLECSIYFGAHWLSFLVSILDYHQLHYGYLANVHIYNNRCKYCRIHWPRSFKTKISPLAWVVFPLRPWSLHMDNRNAICLLSSNSKFWWIPVYKFLFSQARMLCLYTKVLEDLRAMLQRYGYAICDMIWYGIWQISGKNKN